jgi:hypothetical protein
MEKIPFDSSITAKIYHSAKVTLYGYVGGYLVDWGRLPYEEITATVAEVEAAVKGKSSITEESTELEKVCDKLLKSIVSALLEVEAPAKKEVVKEETPVEKKAPASKKKK